MNTICFANNIKEETARDVPTLFFCKENLIDTEKIIHQAIEDRLKLSQNTRA